MFGEGKIRFYIRAVWLICFVAIWLFFKATLPNEDFKIYLNKIELSVSQKDWSNAKRSMEQLKEIYESKKLVIQMNNATEIYMTFDFTMGQLEYAVKNEQVSAVEYVGALNSSLRFVMKAFSGP